MMLIIGFLLQDFIQVIFGGANLAPLVFLIFLWTYSFKKNDGVKLLLLSFFGGMLWDLRWSSTVGITSLSWIVGSYIFWILKKNVLSVDKGFWVYVGIGFLALLSELLFRMALFWFLATGIITFGVILSQFMFGLFLLVGVFYLSWYLGGR